MKPDLCIYHGNCADGFTAAWAVWRCWPDIAFHAGVYGEPPPDVRGKHVLMVDFSYKRPVLEQMADDACTITILDHHKTAEADLRDFVRPEMFEFTSHPFSDFRSTAVFMGLCNVRARFDMEKSGAMLAWEFCHDQPAPSIVIYVQDRDLWRFALPFSREIAAYIFSHSYDFATWNRIQSMLDEPMLLQAAADQGAAIERKHHKDIADLLKQTQRTMVIGGQRVPVANLPYTMSSDAAGQMAADAPFAACYFDRADARIFSLRSRPFGADVSQIAAAYGGGGHRNAAGFQMPIGWEGDDETRNG